ncbi:MAG: DUF29 domain-containing protein [Nitrococcus sp.]|nr:DUF29 domain-containing protein [Nitrococcus sp.]
MTDPNEDYYGWTQETIEMLRQGRLSEVNVDDLIEELEDMAKGERRELRNRLAVLLAQLLKWQYQPSHQARSWRATIKEQRHQIVLLLRNSPSLKPVLEEILNEAYPSAVQRAVRETDLDENTFPASFEQTGWTCEQVLDSEFYSD